MTLICCFCSLLEGESTAAVFADFCWVAASAVDTMSQNENMYEDETEEQRTRSMAIQRFNDKINKLNADAGGPDKDKSRSPRAEAAQGSSGNALAPNQNLQKRKQLQSLGCALKGNQTET